MRSAFIEALTLAEREPLPWLVTGDLGWNAIEPFRDAHPERFLNAGVSEQAMTSVAAGIASATGAAVFTYSIANFPTFRCLEQIRNDVVYHGNPVAIVALGAGFTYGTLGYTHFALEDLAIMRALGNISIYCPCDELETKMITRALAQNPHPAYLRLGRAGEQEFDCAESPKSGSLRCIAPGKDVAIICSGSIIHEALDARSLLHAHGIFARVISCHTIRPLDTEMLQQLSSDGVSVVAVEEHRTSGGLGTELLEVCAQADIKLDILSLGVQTLDLLTAGSRAFLLQKHGLDGPGIAAQIEEWLSEPS